ncbi:hypothetical protein RXV86_08780 [Alisedimentitalea sp. MJ-SS2]|uniref:hypothetical protein n=1 Tax=Aliisedimentitalea sp. MJ-SS2 TaxID=3049795 RepID=UPI00290EC5C5|nr:hypothetical protein [Alisedimentitalea sp. MJ-SS2]MDU8927475.1 hypothetical protein [Alisedimentitalea sp. MJ-SS2]
MDRWRRANANRLAELGFPTEVVDDHNRFLLAVQNAEDWETGWNSGWIVDNDAAPLLSLLTERFEPGEDLVDNLHRRIDPDWRRIPNP